MQDVEDGGKCKSLRLWWWEIIGTGEVCSWNCNFHNFFKLGTHPNKM